MGYYNQATICENGHVMSSTQANSQKFCSKCGAPTISECPNCHTLLRGTYEVEGVITIGVKYQKEYYCHHCGKPYPWTQKTIDSAVEILSLDQDLNDDQREVLKNAIPDLLVETPKTSVSIARYKLFLQKAPELISNALYQVFVDVLSEAVRKSLFPQKPQ